MVALDPDLPEIDDFRTLFLEDTPLLDVRAPVEFAAGAFPAAHNLPLVDDEERHRIGITYKDEGQDAAIALGEQLVAGTQRATRIAQWRAFIDAHPDAVLYCFRGGMRSRISQQWIRDASGIALPRIRGGYKALRRFLLDELERLIAELSPVVIGGRTGAGKTRFLQTVGPMIDLERLAWHRGSAFGRHATPQPAQIDFENATAIGLLKIAARGHTHYAVEDESRNIGGRHLPPALHARMAAAPLVVLDVDDDYRVDITLQEYVHDALAEHVALYGATPGFARWAQGLRDSLDRIRKRLGGTRHAAIRNLLDTALEEHAAHGDTGAHRDWIRALLLDYYDTMYNYQLDRKRERLLFKGDRRAVAHFLAETFGIHVR